MTVDCQDPLPTAAAQDLDASAPAAAEGRTYGQILRSTTLIGASSLVNVAAGILRAKVMAALLGPSGVGLMGMYSSIADVSRSIAEMGINSSGVRQIAEAAGAEDAARIARTATVLRRISIALGILGALLLAGFAGYVSIVSFGNDQHAASVALLSLAVFFRLVADGQGALIQGVRRIADLARMGILGALIGTLISLVLVYFLREDGVALSLVGIAALSLALSTWYSRKIEIRSPAMSVAEIRHEVSALLKLGVAFMASGLLMMGAGYAVRVLVLRQVGLEAAGFYQAAWVIGGLYVGFILDAMGADFYPRLTAAARDNKLCNRLANEQAQVSLLLAAPGVIATLTFAPLVISLFYSAAFSAAVGILRWLCLGMALRVVIWPIGFILLAKGARRIFFWTEFAWAAIHLGLAWTCVRAFGADGAGIAFFGAYACHGVLIYLIVRRLSGFRFSTENIRTGLVFFASIGAVFVGFQCLPALPAAALGIAAVSGSTVHSLRTLLKLVSPEQMPAPVRRFFAWFTV